MLASCAAARHHADKPDPPCGSGADVALSVPGMRHEKGHPHHHPSNCSSPAVPERGGTPAAMTVSGFQFQQDEDGGLPAACDGRYHSDRDMLAALSTGWYAGGRRCHRRIRFASARTRRAVEAEVVDECDSRRGCGCNVVVTSPAVWKALGLDTNVGEVPVTWSDDV
uniref:Expansin-like EG45 domain-containing protein n=2 Tax=Setaria viridis TaxID=4556 RepID=A0A4U6UWZ5_SETVI|nr:hypothetical protein SEVIR_5G260900v2 [Setaria viridis]